MSEVGLIIMPWASTSMPSIALGLLKSVLNEKNISADVHYLNIMLAKLMDKELYEDISGSTTYASEWIFSKYLSGEIAENVNNLDIDKLINETLEYDQYLYMYLKRRKKSLEGLIDKVIPQFLNQCMNEINWEKYKVIGFTCMIGYQVPSLLLAKMIKQRFPNIKVIFGGPNVREKTGEEILKNYEFVDYIIDGEGEQALPDLVSNIMEGNFNKEIPGVLLRKNGIVVRSEGIQDAVDMDTLPVPDYAEYFKDIKESGIDKIIPIKMSFESSRGCWWGQKCQCSFCGLSNGYLNFRSKSSNKVIDEITYQSERYGVKKLVATDLILGQELFDELFPEFINRKMELDIFYEVKPNLKREQIALLSKAGVKTVQAGIESLNTKLLKLLRKGVSAIKNLHFLKWSEIYNIEVMWNLLYRIPGEDIESYNQMLKVLPLIAHLKPPSTGTVIQIALDRFSPYYMNVDEYSIKDIKPKGVFELAYKKRDIDINNMSYTFDFTYPNADEIVYSYIESLATSVAIWYQSYEERKFYFRYYIQGDIVHIEDNRPIIFDQKSTNDRKLTLDDLSSQIFLFCNEVKSFEEIRRELSQNRGLNQIDIEHIKKILNQLVDDRLIYKENEMYLNFATIV